MAPNKIQSREDSGGFVNFEDRPEEFIHRTEKFDAPMGDAEFVPNQHDPESQEIRPRYRPTDPESGQTAGPIEKEVL